MSIELLIESIGFEGKSIARAADGFVYFVEGGVPGDRVRAEIRKRKKNYAEARIADIIKPSTLRVQSRCKHFGVCGGCKWQHLDYAEQCRWKEQHVRDAFERICKAPIGRLHATLPAPEPYFYRNKMEFSFGDSRWLTSEEIARANDGDELARKDFAVGLHIPGRFDKILDVEECFLQSEISSRLLNAVRQAALERGASAFQTRTHKGFLRHLVVRTSRGSGEIMAILVTSPVAEKSDAAFLEWFERDCLQDFPEITTAVHAVSSSKAQVAGGATRTLKGEGVITETLLGIRYRISPFSFFQTNTAQAERLFQIALDFAGDLEGKTVWDLYCGAGSITLAAARAAKFVVGIEIAESSVLDARANAEANGITNVEFTIEDMRAAVKNGILARLPAPDCVILDPPRAGLHPEVVENLRALRPPRIVYVSCNPATQARDCAALAEEYSIEELQPVDMFPHTYHIESVARLERRNN